MKYSYIMIISCHAMSCGTHNVPVRVLEGLQVGQVNKSSLRALLFSLSKNIGKHRDPQVALDLQHQWPAPAGSLLQDRFLSLTGPEQVVGWESTAPTPAWHSAALSETFVHHQSPNHF